MWIGQYCNKRTVQLLRNMKNVLHPTMTHLYCCTKDESEPLFHQSVTQLGTVKLGFDQIRNDFCFVGLSLQVAVLVIIRGESSLS